MKAHLLGIVPLPRYLTPCFLVLVVLLTAGCGSDKDRGASPTRLPAPTFTPAQLLAQPLAPSTLPATTLPVTPSAPLVTPTEAPAPSLDTETTPLDVAAQIAPATTANADANLRSGPGTEYPIVGNVAAGQPLDTIASNPASDWYQLVDGMWIAAFLVDNAPAGLPVAQAIQAPPVPQEPVSVPTASEPPAVAQPVAPSQPVQQPAPSNCDPSYPTVCIPSPPPDLNCSDIPHGRFTVLPPDPHGFDGNNKNGIGCESN